MPDSLPWPVIKPWNSVSVSCHCCDSYNYWSWWLKATQIYYLKVLEVSSLKSRCSVGPHSSQSLQERIHLLPFPASRGHLLSLACGPSSIFTVSNSASSLLSDLCTGVAHTNLQSSVLTERPLLTLQDAFRVSLRASPQPTSLKVPSPNKVTF